MCWEFFYFDVSCWNSELLVVTCLDEIYMCIHNRCVPWLILAGSITSVHQTYVCSVFMQLTDEGCHHE